jgi:hypothetical protein
MLWQRNQIMPKRLSRKHKIIVVGTSTLITLVLIIAIVMLAKREKVSLITTFNVVKNYALAQSLLSRLLSRFCLRPLNVANEPHYILIHSGQWGCSGGCLEGCPGDFKNPFLPASTRSVPPGLHFALLFLFLFLILLGSL